MLVTKDHQLKNLIIIGDRALIRLKSSDEKTSTGLFLPPGVQEKEKVQSGYVIKTGPGYPIPAPAEGYDEPWKEADEKIKYIPLQVREGDLAIFLQKDAIEVQYHSEKYFIVPQYAILMVERDEQLFS
jgi:chaperonin GroES